ncbi:unnamed protein product [Effrenium voratum]|nr:unnamed protein product [Effrenium voratum]
MQAKQVALWMLLVSANAQLRTSTTCSIPCKPGEFKADPLVVLCGGGRCTAEVTLGKGKDRTMITLPVGTKGVELKIDADDDMDIELQDASDGHCIAGARCTGASFEAVEGCANPTDYCLQYEGMSWYFTGDRQEAPVVEELKTQGRVRILERGLASKSKRLNFGHREDDKQGSPKV